jgi:hypothetical protein
LAAGDEDRLLHRSGRRNLRGRGPALLDDVFEHLALLGRQLVELRFENFQIALELGVDLVARFRVHAFANEPQCLPVGADHRDQLAMRGGVDGRSQRLLAGRRLRACEDRHKKHQ